MSDPADQAPDEPIDAEFEPAPSRAALAFQQGPGWISLGLAMLVAIGAGAALGTMGTRYLAAPTDAEGVNAAEIEALRTAGTRLQERAMALETAMEALENRLDQAEQALAGQPGRMAPPAAVLAEIEARLEVLERTEPNGDSEPGSRALAAMGGRLDRLERELESLGETAGALNERVAALDAALREAAGNGRLADLTAELADLRTSLGDLRADINTVRSEALTTQQVATERAERRAAAAVALSTIEAAARRGQGFSGAYANLARALPDHPEMARLEPLALAGAPTLETLRADFPAVREAVRTAASPEAGDDALGLAGRLFGDQIQVEREGEQSVADALNAAETALAGGDLGAAIDALERLGGGEATAAQDWLEAARGRRQLERTLDTLRLDLMREER